MAPPIINLGFEINIRRHLEAIGLNAEEINYLKIGDAIQYLRFFHWKKWGISSILFVGFSKYETDILSKKAENCDLIVKKRISNNLSFICQSEAVASKKFKLDDDCNTIILLKSEFELIFNESEYKLFENELLYDPLVAKEFRITKPLSNFNKNIQVDSFSYDSGNIYVVNIYAMTCTCKDYEKKLRNQYATGDIRRMCKHLIDAYKNYFGLNGLSEMNKIVITSGYPLKKHFRYFNLDNVLLPIAVNFDFKDDWWSVFMVNGKGNYCRYGYLPSEKRFSNDGKPYGHVAELRKKLSELAYHLPADMNTNPAIKFPLKRLAYFTVGLTSLAFALLAVLFVLTIIIVIWSMVFN